MSLFLHPLLRPDRLALMAVVPAHLLLTVALTYTLEPAAHHSSPWWPMAPRLHLVLALTSGLSLTISGLLLNDLMDRPSPPKGLRSPVNPRGSALVIATAVLLALVAAAPLGTTALFAAALMVAGLLFYNLTGRFLPAAGIITFGLLHALVMVLPNPALAFAWPLLLVFSMAVVGGTLEHHLADRRPRLSSATLWGLVAGWGFWCLLLLAVIASRTHARGLEEAAEPSALTELAFGFWLFPALACAGFLLWSLEQSLRPIHRQQPPTERAARLRLGTLLWLIAHDAAWLLAIGRPGLALACLALALPPLARWYTTTPPRPPSRGRPSRFSNFSRPSNQRLTINTYSPPRHEDPYRA